MCAEMYQVHFTRASEEPEESHRPENSDSLGDKTNVSNPSPGNEHPEKKFELSEKGHTQVSDDEYTGSHLAHSSEENSSGENDVLKGKHEVDIVPMESEEYKMSESSATPEVPDGGCRAWLVCMASFYCFGVLSAVITTFGILYVELLEVFKDEGGDIAFKTGWIGSLNSCLTFGFSFISSLLVDTFGIRLVASIGVVLAVIGLLTSSFVPSIGLMYFTYGIVLGIGFSLMFVPMLAILPHYFNKHLGKINGLVTFGGAAFTIANSFALPAMFKTIGFRNAMRVEAAMVALVGLAPIVWKPTINTSTNDTETRSKSLKEMFKREPVQDGARNVCTNKRYLVWCVGLTISLIGYFIPFTHLVNYSTETFPGYPANILVMCVGGITGVSRLSLGNVADHPAVKPNWILQVSSMVLAICTSLVTFAPNFGVLVFIAVMMGIGDGGLISMINPTVTDIVDGKRLVQGIGIAWSLIGLAMTCGPPLAGLMYDKMGTYTLVFLVGAIPMLVGPNIMFLMPSEPQYIQ